MSEAEAYDLAYEEVVADACESFLADGDASHGLRLVVEGIFLRFDRHKRSGIAAGDKEVVCGIEDRPFHAAGKVNGHFLAQHL